MEFLGSSPELSEYEKERGKPLPSYHHCVAQGRLIGAFGPSQNYSIVSEPTLELSSGRRLTPDLCIFPKLRPDWNHDVMPVKAMPLLAVEILSVGQDVQEAENKIAAYFADGVESAWLVQPGTQTIAIYLPGARRPQIFTTGEVKDPVTGLTARLDEVFA